jgi:hypothetical protein
VNDQHTRHGRVRYAAIGALGALAAAGAIAGATALAANPSVATPANPAAATGPKAGAPAAKTPTPPVPGKVRGPQPGSDQPFLNAAQQLVSSGTITASEGQILESEIQAGQVDTTTLASSGFTPTQLQAVQQALSTTKEALGPTSPAVGQGKTGTSQADAKARRAKLARAVRGG